MCLVIHGKDDLATKKCLAFKHLIVCGVTFRFGSARLKKKKKIRKSDLICMARYIKG